MEEYSQDWILVSNYVKPESGLFTVNDLRAGTNYDFRITAHNSAGSSVKTYKRTTSSVTEGALSSSLGEKHSAQNETVMSWKVITVATAMSSILFIGVVYISHHLGKR